MTLEELLAIHIETPSGDIHRRIKEAWDGMAKPLDAMGRFEELIAQIGAILGRTSFDLKKKAVVIMCADNGIVSEKISQSGQEVTLAVTQAMGRRQSSVCKMANAVCADIFPVDVGVNAKEELAGVRARKVRAGTRNFRIEPAMTEEETIAAIQTGIDMVRECKEAGYELIATGEMGIGNTTTSSAMAAAMLGLTAAEVTGRGAGLSNAGLERKIQVIDEALRRYAFEKDETFRILSTVGGLDIAGLVGVCIGGARYHVPIVLDGVISVVAALAAERLRPGVREYCIPSHISRESAAARMLDELRLCPVIDASMALGEGTGAVMMFALLDVAMELFKHASSFSDIQVEQYTRFS